MSGLRLLAILIFLPALVFSQNAPFKVTLVIGDAEYFVETQTEDGWKTVEYEMMIPPDTRIRTGENSRVELIRGSDRFRISQKSVLKVKDLGSPTTPTVVQLIAGKVLSLIDNTEGPKLFNLMTPSAVLGVRGTSFLSVADSKVTSLYVFSGVVEASSPDGKFEPVQATPAKMLTVSSSGKVSALKKIPFQVYQEWGMEVPPTETLQPQKQEPEKTVEPEPLKEEPLVLPKAVEPVVLPEPAVVSNGVPSAPTNTVPVEKPSLQPRPEKPKPPKEPIKPSFKMDANIGPANINSKSYYQVILMPEFGIGKFGIGLYLPAYLDLTKMPFPATEWGNPYDWDFRGVQDGFNDFFNKILFIGYDKKGAPLYIKIGNIPDMTLGYGFLMNLFSNMLEFPVKKRIGIQFDVNTKFGGFETMCDDVFLFQVYGGRAYINPLFWSSSKLLQKVNSGFTYIVDSKPFLQDKNPEIHLWSVDAGLAISDSSVFSLSLYGNYGSANLVKGTTNLPYKGGATVAGFKGKFLIIPYKFEYRYLQNGFFPEYFDNGYINNRQTKYTTLAPGFYDSAFYQSYNGLLFEMGTAFGKLGAFMIQFQANLDKENDNRLRLDLDIEKGLIPKVYGSFAFDKLNVVSFKDLYYNFLDYRTTLTFEGVYQADPKIDIAFIWKRTFLWKDNKWEPLTSVSMETRFSFF